MTAATTIGVPAAVLEDNRLGALDRAQNGSLYPGTFDNRLSDSYFFIIGNQQDAVKTNRLTIGQMQKLNLKDLTFLDAVLFAARFDH